MRKRARQPVPAPEEGASAVKVGAAAPVPAASSAEGVVSALAEHLGDRDSAERALCQFGDFAQSSFNFTHEEAVALMGLAAHVRETKAAREP